MVDGMIGCQWFRLVSIRCLIGKQVQQPLVSCSIGLLMDWHDVANEEDLDSVMEKQQKAWVLFRDAVLPGLKS